MPKIAAGVDVERAAAEVADALEQAVDAGEEHEADALATTTLFASAFMIGVVDHEADGQRDQHDGQPEPRIADVVLSKSTVLVW